MSSPRYAPPRPTRGAAPIVAPCPSTLRGARPSPASRVRPLEIAAPDVPAAPPALPGPLTKDDVADAMRDVVDLVLDAAEVLDRTRRSLPPVAGRGLSWFRAFRRTRPFWGALWLTIAGYWILHFSLGSVLAVVTSGFAGVGGWLVSGGMILCGVVACIAPSQRLTAGIIGTLLSITSLVASNFGGFFVGLALGVVGSAMILSWGPKQAPREAL